MNQTLALGLLRHALQLGSGYAVAHGLWKDGDTETIVGAVLSIVTFVWMWLDQRKAGQLVAAQVAAAQASIPAEVAPTLQQAADVTRQANAAIEQVRGLADQLGAAVRAVRS